MKIGFIGSVEFSYGLLETLLKSNEAEIVAVVTKKKSTFNTDFKSHVPLAQEFKIPCLELEKNNEDKIINFLEQISIDVIYCFGWSHLLKKRLLALAPKGCVGYHPAEIPYNRGRHPIIWALALGLQKTASTFFQLNEKADQGDIISQESVAILKSDDARTLYDKLLVVAKKQVLSFTKDLINDNITPMPQDLNVGNEWRKRGKADGIIDWRMSSKNVYNLVRALTKPYVGATLVSEGTEVSVWKCEVAKLEEKFQMDVIEPGKVLKSDENGIAVKTGDGAIMILEHTFTDLPEEGSYL